MRVGELAAKTGVSVRLLHYYEQQGLLNPDRTASGHRIYDAADERTVTRIRQLLAAGFCSKRIRDLLPRLSDPISHEGVLRREFDAARCRLESERAAVERELAALALLSNSYGLASPMHVRRYVEAHDNEYALPQAIAFDHRDRRLR